MTNLGAASHGTASTAFYLSTDPVLDAGDTFLTSSDSEFDLGFRQSVQIPITFKAPLTLPGGNYYLLAHLDFSPEEADANADNNTVVAAGTIKVIPPINNIIPAIVGPRGRRFAPGATLPFTLRLKNSGNVTATGSVTAAFSLISVSSPGSPAIALSTVPLDVIIKNGTSKVLALSDLLPLEIAPGVYRLSVTITSTLATAESNLADNTANAIAKFTVVAPAP
jgi:hypothetical protein